MNEINKRRALGGVLLLVYTIFAFMKYRSFFTSTDTVVQYQLAFYIYILWGLIIGIWYLATMKSFIHKRLEISVKIIFFITCIVCFIYDSFNLTDNGRMYGVALMIIYSIGCPWGKTGYTNWPYVEETYEHKAWYKRWWVWPLLVVAAFCQLFGMINVAASNNTTPLPYTNGNDKNTLTVNDTDYQFKSKKTYKINDTSSWHDGDAKLTKITVYKLDKKTEYSQSENNTYDIQGFARVYITFKADADSEVKTSNSRVTVSDNGINKAIPYDDDWDDEITGGDTVSSSFIVPLKKLKSSTSLKWLDVDFHVTSEESENMPDIVDFNVYLDNYK